MGNWSSSDEFPKLSCRNPHKYGWIPDLPDKRDIWAQMPLWNALPQTPNVDLRTTGQMPDVYDQGNLGSCTAQAIAAAYEFDTRKQKSDNYFTPSRLFIYYNERLIEGTPMSDSGASLRDGLRVMGILGAPPESDYPYDITRFAIEPPLRAYRIAHKHRAIKYRRVPQNTSIMSALYLGYPVIFGFSVYDYFESDEFGADNILRIPKPDENLLGGHAVLLCGYRTMPDQTIQFLVRNSWGPKWHGDGYFWMEYAYLMDPNLSGDFWVIETVSEPTKEPTIEPTIEPTKEPTKEPAIEPAKEPIIEPSREIEDPNEFLFREDLD